MRLYRIEYTAAGHRGSVVVAHTSTVAACRWVRDFLDAEEIHHVELA